MAIIQYIPFFKYGKSADDLPELSPFVSQHEQAKKNDAFVQMRQFIPTLKSDFDVKTAVITNNYFIDRHRQISALYIDSVKEHFDLVCFLAIFY